MEELTHDEQVQDVFANAVADFANLRVIILAMQVRECAVACLLFIFFGMKTGLPKMSRDQKFPPTTAGCLRLTITIHSYQPPRFHHRHLPHLERMGLSGNKK
nr:hypothetical protein CFP56_04167 [Quercus suber]